MSAARPARSPALARRFAAAGLALLCGAPAAGQDPPGRVRIDGERAVVFFEAGQFSAQEMERFAGLVDRGVADVERFLNGARAAPAAEQRIRFVVRSGLGMSRSFRRTVLLPAERVRADAAPYLHETTHVLAPARGDALWLAEGFASYVQSYVAENMGGYDGYVFSWGGNRHVDRLALRYLASERGQAVLPYVGAAGSPEGLWRERRQVAAPFYVLSHSFLKFLVEEAGLECVKALLQASDVGGELARATGRAADRWKSDWLARLLARRG